MSLPLLHGGLTPEAEADPMGWVSFPRALENGLRIVLAAEVWYDVEGKGMGSRQRLPE